MQERWPVLSWSEHRPKAGYAIQRGKKIQKVAELAGKMAVFVISILIIALTSRIITNKADHISVIWRLVVQFPLKRLSKLIMSSLTNSFHMANVDQ